MGCITQLGAQLQYYICHFLSELLLKSDHVCCGDHAYSRLAAGLADAAAAESRALNWLHSRRRLVPLRYHVKNFVSSRKLSQRECVGGSVPRSEDWGALCRSETYIQIERETEREKKSQRERETKRERERNRKRQRPDRAG